MCDRSQQFFGNFGIELGYDSVTFAALMFPILIVLLFIILFNCKNSHYCPTSYTGHQTTTSISLCLDFY